MTSFEHSLDQIRRALYKVQPDVGLEYYGIATHLIDIENFYIVPLSVYHLMHVLEKPGKQMEEIIEHSHVIYYSPTLLQYARGMIRAINPNGSCVIYALDYGVTDMEVARSNIFHQLNKGTDTIPGLAQFCELSMCYPRGGGVFTEEAVETFKFFMGQKGEKLVVAINEKTDYKLRVLVMSSNSNPDTVSKVLAFTNHSSLYPAPL